MKIILTKEEKKALKKLIKHNDSRAVIQDVYECIIDCKYCRILSLCEMLGNYENPAYLANDLLWHSEVEK